MMYLGTDHGSDVNILLLCWFCAMFKTLAVTHTEHSFDEKCKVTNFSED